MWLRIRTGGPRAEKRDEQLRPESLRVWNDNHAVYGADKVWHQLGWRVSSSLESDLAPDALEPALHARPDANGVVHHSDRGTASGDGSQTHDNESPEIPGRFS